MSVNGCQMKLWGWWMVGIEVTRGNGSIINENFLYGMKEFHWKSALFMLEARLYSGCSLKARIRNFFDRTAPTITIFGLESRNKTISVVNTLKRYSIPKQFPFDTESMNCSCQISLQFLSARWRKLEDEESVSIGQDFLPQIQVSIAFRRNVESSQSAEWSVLEAE